MRFNSILSGVFLFSSLMVCSSQASDPVLTCVGTYAKDLIHWRDGEVSSERIYLVHFDGDSVWAEEHLDYLSSFRLVNRNRQSFSVGNHNYLNLNHSGIGTEVSLTQKWFDFSLLGQAAAALIVFSRLDQGYRLYISSLKKEDGKKGDGGEHIPNDIPDVEPGETGLLFTSCSMDLEHNRNLLKRLEKKTDDYRNSLEARVKQLLNGIADH